MKIFGWVMAVTLVLAALVYADPFSYTRFVDLSLDSDSKGFQEFGALVASGIASGVGFLTGFIDGITR